MDSVQICSEVFLEIASFITCKPQPQLVCSHVEAGNRELYSENVDTTESQFQRVRGQSHNVWALGCNTGGFENQSGLY